MGCVYNRGTKAKPNFWIKWREHGANRFQRVGADAGPFVQAVRDNGEALLDSVGGLVQRQAELWAATVEAIDRRSEEAHARPREQMLEALENGLSKTLRTHAECLAALEGKAVEQTAGPFYLVKVLERALFHFISQPFQIVRPSQRVDSVRYAGLFCNNLLGP